MRSRAILAVATLCFCLGAGREAPRPKLSERQQIRAYYQVKALSHLGRWEARKLYPDRPTMRDIEEQKAAREAIEHIARQYAITTLELRKIVARGQKAKWPEPMALVEGDDVSLSDNEKAGVWHKTVRARQAKGQMTLVRDAGAKTGMAARSENMARGMMFVFEGIKIPAAGKYRVTFYCRLEQAKADSKRPPRATFRVDGVVSKDRWRTLARKSADAANMDRRKYAPYSLECRLKRPTEVRVAILQQFVILRVDRVYIAEIKK